MNIQNAVVLVTGANRGIGLAFAQALLARGARKVYAAARDPATVTLSGVQALRLDVTKPEEIAAAAQQANDVTLVINNAGIAQPGGFLADDSDAVARRIFETNFFGVLNVSKTFAPVLKANGGGALLNVLSVASWHWLFAVNVPLGLLVLWLGRRALPGNSRTSVVTIVPLDVLLNMLAFGLVFLGADGLGTRGGADASTTPIWVPLGQLALGLLLGVVYLRRQLRLAVPLFPLDLLRIPVFALSMCTSVAAFCAQMLAYIALPFLLFDYFGRTPWEAGMLITAWPLATIVAAPLAGRLIGRYPDGLLGGIGLGLLACGLALLAALPTQPGDLDIAWRMALCGLGFGLFQSPNNHTILTVGPAQRSGSAGGMLGTARLTGQSLAAVLAASLFSVWPPAAGVGPLVALGLAAGCAAFAAVASSLRLKF